MQHYILQHRTAPGDILVMSALVRDLSLAYPDRFKISVKTTSPELWQHNPYVVPLPQTTVQHDITNITLDYKASLDRAGDTNRHFITSFHENFESQTGIHVPLLYPRPDYHLSEEEKTVPLISGRYWVVISGGKTDFATKHWCYKRWQQVVNILHGADIEFVQLGAIGHSEKLAHFHPQLENTLCLVGMTTLRDAARIIYHADGVICPITFFMHMAAALQKPCVVLAGGREEWWWAAYAASLGNFGDELKEDVKVQHRFLHTIGKLDCCRRRGCWKNALLADQRSCKRPLNVGGQIMPECMHMITVNHVVEAVMSYYEDGTLPPISEPKCLKLVDGEPRFLEADELPSLEPSALEIAMNFNSPQLLVPTAAMQQAQ